MPYMFDTPEAPDPQDYPILENALNHARGCFDDLTEPDEDILPVMLWVGPYGVGIMPLLDMSDAAAKDALADMMTTSLACSRASQAVMISTSWMVKQKTDDEGKPVSDDLGDVMPSQHPDRLEVVTAMYVSSVEGSDSMTHAVITRSAGLPVLGPWEGVGEKAPANLGGRFGDAMHKGIWVADKMPPEMVKMLDDGWKAGEQKDLIERFHKVMTGSVPSIGLEIMDVNDA